MRANLAHLLDTAGLTALEKETHANVVALFHLGNDHFTFASGLSPQAWRQRISRYYYGAYNIARAVRLADSGVFSTDSSDHKRVGELPSSLANHQTYLNRLPVLRDDRNLCDYDHSAVETDLAIPVVDAEQLVRELESDARTWLVSRGIHP